MVAMIQCRTAAECIAKIKRSIVAGAEAIGLQLCQLRREERTEKHLKNIFAACGDLPVYVTSYRLNQNEGLGEEECAAYLLSAAELGGTLMDIPTDTFAPSENQFTTDAAAIRKQKDLAKAIHDRGGEVLFSTHDFRDLSGEEIMKIAAAQAERGADVIKIVVRSESKSRLPEYLATIERVKAALGKPFLFLDVGANSTLLRRLGGTLGSAMYLCVESHSELDTAVQPTLKQVLAIRNALEE